MWNKAIQNNMKVLQFVGGAVVLTRVPNTDLRIIYLNISLIFVVDRNTANVVDTPQVNCPPGVVLFYSMSTYFLIPINSSLGIEWVVSI